MLLKLIHLLVTNGAGACGALRERCVVRQTQCGVNCFILDSRRVLAPAPWILRHFEKKEARL